MSLRLCRKHRHVKLSEAQCSHQVLICTYSDQPVMLHLISGKQNLQCKPRHETHLDERGSAFGTEMSQHQVADVPDLDLVLQGGHCKHSTAQFASVLWVK